MNLKKNPSRPQVYIDVRVWICMYVFIKPTISRANSHIRPRFLRLDVHVFYRQLESRFGGVKHRFFCDVYMCIYIYTCILVTVLTCSIPLPSLILRYIYRLSYEFSIETSILIFSKNDLEMLYSIVNRVEIFSIGQSIAITPKSYIYVLIRQQREAYDNMGRKTGFVVKWKTGE